MDTTAQSFEWECTPAYPSSGPTEVMQYGIVSENYREIASDIIFYSRGSRQDLQQGQKDDPDSVHRILEILPDIQ